MIGAYPAPQAGALVSFIRKLTVTELSETNKFLRGRRIYLGDNSAWKVGPSSLDFVLEVKYEN